MLTVAENTGYRAWQGRGNTIEALGPGLVLCAYHSGMILAILCHNQFSNELRHLWLWLRTDGLQFSVNIQS